MTNGKCEHTILEWTHDIPIKVGLYLRLNPVLAHYRPLKVAVFEIEGKLCVGGQGLNALRLSEWHAAPHFLWYGPIDPPKRRKQKWVESGKNI